MLYTEATTKGNSGSPLYEIRENKARVVGLHVAGHNVANTSVPIMYHMTPRETLHDEVTTKSKDSKISEGEINP